MLDTMGTNDDTPHVDRGRMRVSDSERDEIAERLREAFAEGRLDHDEHSERVDAVYLAKTRAELDALVVDLPNSGSSLPATRPDGTPAPVEGAGRIVSASPSSTSAVAVFSGAERSGEWVVPERFTAVGIMGGVELDLREARFTAKETTIQAHALMGAVEIAVPDDVVVRMDGIGIMGAFWKEGDSTPVSDPDAPVVRVVGVALMGAVWGEPKLREHQKPKKESWWKRLTGGDSKGDG